MIEKTSLIQKKPFITKCVFNGDMMDHPPIFDTPPLVFDDNNFNS